MGLLWLLAGGLHSLEHGILQGLIDLPCDLAAGLRGLHHGFCRILSL